MTYTDPKGTYSPVAKNGLFFFKLEPTDIERNNRLTRAFTGMQRTSKAISATILDSNTTISGAPSLSGTTVLATLNVANQFFVDSVEILDGEFIILAGEQLPGGLGAQANGLYSVVISGTSLTLNRVVDVSRALQLQETIVSIGGIVLPIKSFIPKQVRYEIKSRNWLSKAVMGFRSQRKTKRFNRDGSVTEIVETTYTQRDGTKITETQELTTGSPFVTSSSKRREMTNQTYVNELDGTTLYPINATDSNGNLLPVPDRKDLSNYPIIKATKTVITPPDKEIEYVHEKEEITYPLTGGDTSDSKHSTYMGAATVRTKTSEYSYVHNKEPLRLAKPVTLVSITGKVINQFLLPPPPQGRDDSWWNDQMGNDETRVPGLGYPPLDTSGTSGNKVITTTYTKDLGDGTEEVKTDVETKNPDGEVTIESTSVIRAKGDLYTPETFQITTKEPLKTTVERRSYDRQGVLVKTEINTTSNVHRDTQALPPMTITENKVIDERGKTSVTTTKKWKESDGKEYEEIIESIEGLGRHVTNKSISEQIDHENKTKSISETTTVTDALGNSYTEEQTRKEFIDEVASSSEAVTEEYDDLIINELVVGRLVTEYQISGEFMTADQAYRLLNKNMQHQNAWALFELLNAQLDLGEKVSPKVLSALHKQQLQIFTGEVDVTVNPDGTHIKKLGSRGGYVLDRMAFVGFVDKLDLAEGVVFAPGADSFRLEWIDGTDKIFKWSMTLHKYDNLTVQQDDLSFGDNSSPWKITDIPSIDTNGIYSKLNINNIISGS